MIALKLSKSGYGRPDEILAMPADIVVAAMEYDTFLSIYERTFQEINRSEKK